jgi:Caspase domain
VGDADYAIVIGIDRYPDLNRPLKGAVADAEEFAQWVIGPGGVPEGQAKLITSKRRRGKPVHDEIDDYFDMFLKAATERPARRLYVYFAGHGHSSGPNHVNLLMANATKRLLNRGLNAPKYHRALQKGPFEQQLYFYDCCRGDDQRAIGAGPTFPTWSSKGPIIVPPMQVVYYAVLFGRRSIERVTVGGTMRGLFTSALLEGLKGGAAVWHGRGHAVTTASLKTFLDKRMKEKASDEGIRQTPFFQDQGVEQSIVLVDDVTPWSMPVEVSTHRAETQVVVARGNGLERPAEVRDMRARFELPPGIYNLASEPPGEFGAVAVHAAEKAYATLEVSSR